MENLPDDIDLYHLAFEKRHQSQWWSYLSSEEQKRMESFGSKKRRQEFLIGRAAVRILVARRLKILPKEVRLHVADDGAPEVVGSDLQISLAHSHGKAVAVATNRAVGVDLERIQSRRKNLYTYILHEEELEMFETLPGSHKERQILCWALKEATLKALRTGFRISPKRLRIKLDHQQQLAQIRVTEPATCWTVSFARQDDFYLAVAYPANSSEKAA